jgi:hypothetical protein
MTPHPHVIGKQILDIEIDARNDAVALQAAVGELFKTRVVPAMDALFDRLSDHWRDPDTVLRLDRLEIDIGRLNPDGLSEDFAAKVCAALEDELAALLPLQSQDATALPMEGERRSRQEHTLALWHHVLAHGYLPWWAPPSTASDLEARVEALLASLDALPEATAKMLRETPEAQRRLALQGSEATLERVLQLLDKALAAASFPIRDAISDLLEAQPIASVRAEHFRQSWLEAALREGLWPSASATDTRLHGLLRQALKSTVRETPTSYAELLAHLRTCAELSSAAGGATVPASTLRTLSAALRALGELAGPVRNDLARAEDGATKGQRRGAAGEELGVPLQKRPSATDEAETTDSSPPREGPLPQTQGQSMDASAPTDEKSMREASVKSGEESDKAVLLSRDRISPQAERKPTAEPALREAEKLRQVFDRKGDVEGSALPSTQDRAVPEKNQRPKDRTAPRDEASMQDAPAMPRAMRNEAASASEDQPSLGEKAEARDSATARDRLQPIGFQETDSEAAASGVPQGKKVYSRVSGMLSTDDEIRGSDEPAHREGPVIARSGGRKDTPESGPKEGLETHSRGVLPPETGRRTDAAPSVERIHEGEAVYVDDAGIVLLHPFLQAHFEYLELVRDKAFVDEGARERAVHQLHFLATGREEPHEYLLVIAKLLCGLEPQVPIARRVPIDDRAKSQAEELLKAVIGHWSALKSTSPDGLRGSFLCRQGRLTRKSSDGWRLQVESQSWDVLLNRLPWSRSVVRLPWMPELLWIDWA